jgi:hypothetical protein
MEFNVFVRSVQCKITRDSIMKLETKDLFVTLSPADAAAINGGKKGGKKGGYYGYKKEYEYEHEYEHKEYEYKKKKYYY